MEIVKYPDDRLRKRSEDVQKIDDELLSRVREMFDTMYEARGVGLAAVQVGWHVRMFVMNMAAEPPNADNGGEEFICINPRIVSETGSTVEEEGCLSFPGIRGKVARAESVELEYYNERGELVSVEATGFPAVAFQHEIDHLDGKLFISRMTPASKLKTASQLKELEAEFSRLA